MFAYFFDSAVFFSKVFPVLMKMNNKRSLTYRWPGLLQSDDAALLESSSSPFDVAIEPVVVIASPAAGDETVSVFGLKKVVGWPCVLCWWWWWVLALLPLLLLTLIIVAVEHDVTAFVAVNCVSVMVSIWKHSKNTFSAWWEKINNATSLS